MVPRLLVLLLATSVSANAADACRRAIHFAQPLITSMSITSAAYGDFDGDGRVDVALQLSGDVRIVALNRGSVFQPLFQERIAPIGSSAFAAPLVAATDVNGDGRLDLLYRGSSDIWVSFGRGDGTFTSLIPFRLSRDNAGGSSRLVDFNHDGRLDFVDAEFGGGSFTFQQANKDGTYTEVAHVTMPQAQIQSVGTATGDFDGDGNVDVVRIAIDVRTFKYVVNFAWNDGAYHFTQTQEFADIASNFVPLDVDGDGAEELVGIVDGSLVVARMKDRHVSIERIPVAPPGTNQTLRNAVMLDFDRDGIRDLAFSSGTTAGILWGTADHKFRDATYFELPGSSSFVPADIDGDGLPDLATTNGAQGLSVLYAASLRAGQPSANRVYPIGGSGSVALADVNGDGIADLVTTTVPSIPQSGPFRVLFGDGHGGFGRSATFALPLPYIVGQVGDFDGDGHADLVAWGGGNAVVAFGTADGFAAPTLEFPVDSSLSVIAPSPSSPAALVGQRGADMMLFTISPGRTVSTSTIYHRTAGDRPYVVSAAPGAPAQLVIAGTSPTRLLTLDGGAWKESTLLAGTLDSFFAIVSADLNGDGRLDYVAYGDSNTMLLSASDGSYTRRSFGSWGFTNSVTPVDVDRDGNVDLVITSRHNFGDPGTVQVLRNSGGAQFVPYDVATTGAPYGGVAIGDVDGDGWPDVIQVALDGAEVMPNVCATPRVRVEAVPASPREGDPVTLVIHAISTDGFAIGGITISEGGKVLATQQPYLAYDLATVTWSSPPLAPGSHTFQITYNDQFAGSSQTSIVVTPRPRSRTRAIRH